MQPPERYLWQYCREGWDVRVTESESTQLTNTHQAPLLFSFAALPALVSFCWMRVCAGFVSVSSPLFCAAQTALPLELCFPRQLRLPLLPKAFSLHLGWRVSLFFPCVLKSERYGRFRSTAKPYPFRSVVLETVPLHGTALPQTTPHPLLPQKLSLSTLPLGGRLPYFAFAFAGCAV